MLGLNEQGQNDGCISCHLSSKMRVHIQGVKMKIKLADLRLDGGTQPREKISQEVVQEYMDLLNDGAEFPPITVFYDGTSRWLADGFHRYFAHKRAGRLEIEVDQQSGSLRDAVLWSVGANSDHGIRRTNADKRKAVMTLLDDLEWSDWSDREIAKHCNVSYATVSRIKKSLQIEKSEKKFTRNGKEHKIDTANIGPKTKQETPPAPPEQDHDAMKELAVAHTELAEVVVRLQDRLALKAMDASPEEKEAAALSLAELRALTKQQEAEIAALRSSQAQLMAKNAELTKMVAYWRRKAEKVAA